MRRCSRLLLVPNGQKASARRHSVGSVGMAGKAVVYRDVQSIFGATLSWCRKRRESAEKAQRKRRETAEKAVETSTEARSSGKLNITEERKAFDTQDRLHFMAQVHLRNARSSFAHSVSCCTSAMWDDTFGSPLRLTWHLYQSAMHCATCHRRIVGLYP